MGHRWLFGLAVAAACRERVYDDIVQVCFDVPNVAPGPLTATVTAIGGEWVPERVTCTLTPKEGVFELTTSHILVQDRLYADGDIVTYGSGVCSAMIEEGDSVEVTLLDQDLDVAVDGTTLCFAEAAFVPYATPTEVQGGTFLPVTTAPYPTR